MLRRSSNIPGQFLLQLTLTFFGLSLLLAGPSGIVRECHVEASSSSSSFSSSRNGWRWILGRRESDDSSDDSTKINDDVKDCGTGKNQTTATATTTKDDNPSTSSANNSPTRGQQQQEEQEKELEREDNEDDDEDKRVIFMHSTGRPARPVQSERRTGGQGLTSTQIAGVANFISWAEVLTEAGALLWIWSLWKTLMQSASSSVLIPPRQHFFWERLNDQYNVDATHLQDVLDVPPTGWVKSFWNSKYCRRKIRNQPLGKQPSRLQLSGIARVPVHKVFQRTVVVVPIDGEIDVAFLTDVTSFILRQHYVQAFGSQPVNITHNLEQQNNTETPANNTSARGNGPIDINDISSTINDKNLGKTLATSKSRGRHNKTAPTTMYAPMELEVVFLVSSPGGAVGEFGLAAYQIRRLTEAQGITTTVCVDRVAASGGYMMASQADRIIAAPFATLGSIGVYGELLNYYELAKNYGVQPISVKSGNSKNPISSIAQVTERDVQTFQKELDKVHLAFQQLVISKRPQLADKLKKVADGSTFLGIEAMELQLVDQILTSDQYIEQRIFAGDRVLKIVKRPLPHHRRSWWDYVAQKVYQILGSKLPPLSQDLKHEMRLGDTNVPETPTSPQQSLAFFNSAVSRLVHVWCVLQCLKHLLEVASVVRRRA